MTASEHFQPSENVSLATGSHFWLAVALHGHMAITYVLFDFWQNLHIQDNGFLITTERFRLPSHDLLNNCHKKNHKIRSGHNCNSSPNSSRKLRTICTTFVFLLTWTPASYILVPNTPQLACIPISIAQVLQKPRFQKSTLYHSRIIKMQRCIWVKLDSKDCSYGFLVNIQEMDFQLHSSGIYFSFPDLPITSKSWVDFPSKN